jgi:tRNA-(ms[2]io[6]A)-hydroxylase
VLAHLDTFLIDHAACERKAAANAMHFVVRYPDRVELVDRMVGIAREELEHFHQVFHLMRDRGVQLGPDERDPYVNALLTTVRNGRQTRLLDRLLLGSIIEFRGCERFAMLGRLMQSEGEPLGDFYVDLAASESRHRTDFLDVARLYFDHDEVDDRLGELLDREAEIVEDLPIRAALH